MRTIKMIGGLIAFILIMGIAVEFYSQVSESDAWSELVTDGLASNVILAVPIIAVLVAIPLTIYKITRNKDNSGEE